MTTDPITRRRFLGGALVLGGGTLLGCSGGDPSRSAAPTTAAAATARTASAGSGGTLVLIDLDGGNDGLNTVSPVEDGRYRSLRGDLALDPGAAHQLSEGFALHPALAGCKTLWDEDRLAVVHGVGFEGLDRSHFHCRDVWQAGSTGDLSSGWAGRWLDRVGDSALDAVAVDRLLPLLVRGHERQGAVVPPGPFELPDQERLAPLLGTVAGPDPARSRLAEAVAASTGDLLTLVDRVGPVLADADADADADGDRTGPGDTESLTARLDTVATLMAAGLPTRVYTVKLGGFDTHAGQAATHTALLGELDTALTRFLDRVGDRRVTVAAYSEFGRRVRPNASDGTDHGKASVVLLAGDVRAGHHGEPPSLDHLDDGDLATTIDFRSVLGGLAEGVLGVGADELFGTGPRPLALV